MRIGKLDQRVTIQEPTEVRDASGGFTLTWANIGTAPTVWAAVEPSSAGETREGEKATARASYSVRMRYRADITAKIRLSWRGRTLQIEGIPSGSLRSRELILNCVETQD